MEPAVRAYLIRIVNTISVGLSWLAINSTWGIMYGYAFPEEHVQIGNIIFYVWLLISSTAYLWFVLKLWKKPLDFEDKHHIHH
jgi:uncharacterized membrane protein YpjA